MIRWTAPIAGLAVMTLCVPSVALGQIPGLGQMPGGGGGSNRPFRGLFGPGQQPPSRDTLDLMVSGYGAVQDNGPRINSSTQGTTEPVRGGAFGGATAHLTYSHPGDRASFGVSGGTAVSYQPNVPRPLTTSFSIAGQSGFTFGSRTSFGVGQSVQFSPFYRGVYGVFVDPADIDPSTVSPTDYAVIRADSWTYVTTAGMTHRLGQRSAVDINYRLRVVDFRSDDFSLTDQHAGIHFSRELTQRARLRAGYAYRAGRSDMTFRTTAPQAEPVGLHNIDIGVDYSRPLSLTRRTTVNFSTGSALITRTRENNASSQLNSSLMFRLIGGATLQHEIGRSWTARVGYHRDVGFVEGFADPLLSDSVNAGIVGLLTREINLLASVTYSRATPANVSVSDRHHEALAASARLQKALARNLALYAQYVFYESHIGTAVQFPDQVEEFDRHVFRGGLTLWLPLIR